MYKEERHYFGLLVPELYAAETFRLQRQTTTNTILRRSVRMQMHACYATFLNFKQGRQTAKLTKSNNQQHPVFPGGHPSKF